MITPGSLLIFVAGFFRDTARLSWSSPHTPPWSLLRPLARPHPFSMHLFPLLSCSAAPQNACWVLAASLLISTLSAFVEQKLDCIFVWRVVLFVTLLGATIAYSAERSPSWAELHP